MRNLTFVRHKVKHYPHLWLKVKTRSPPTHADGVSHPKIGHFGQNLDVYLGGFHPFEKLPCSKELLRKFFARDFSSGSSRSSPLNPLLRAEKTKAGHSARPLKVLLLLNVPQKPGGYVKDEASNLVPMRDERAVLDSSD